MNIQYGLDFETGLVWSRVGDQVAVPVLDYDAIGPENNFGAGYQLKKFPADVLSHATIRWNHEVSEQAKNAHLAFWGFVPA